ncbi:MAG: type II toxin-antitoxin system RelE/ParE family toxin [Gemmobacter sp.]
MIVSVKDARLLEIAAGRVPERFPANIIAATERRFRSLIVARALEDLREPPGNRLEALKGDRAGQHSIRVNDQWRICFRWTAAGAEDVELVDDH